MLTGFLKSLFASFIIITLTGCAGPLKVNYKAKTPQVKISDPISISIVPFKDERPVKGDPREIGKIDANVSDITGNTLTLSEDVTSIIEKAFAEELSASGYSVKAAPDENADFILSGEIKAFSLDIAARDYVDIAITSKFVERETGKTVWSGTEEVKEDRFAGTMGNSRATISNYISRSLSKAVTQTIANISNKVISTKAATTAPPAAKAAPAVGMGRVLVNTEPNRSKVYINDVYYGLTPLTLDIEPGIYELKIKQKGFKEAKEKVSVRDGQLTEIETGLEKE